MAQIETVVMFGATETILEPQQGARMDLNFLQIIKGMGTYVFHRNVLYYTHLVGRLFSFNNSMDLLFSYIILFQYLLNTDNKELS